MFYNPNLLTFLNKTHLVVNSKSFLKQLPINSARNSLKKKTFKNDSGMLTKMNQLSFCF